jgi:hypothetical protein
MTHSTAIREYVLSLSATLSILGSMIIRGNEDLKLVTATIVGALVQQEYKHLSLFWPEGTLASQMLKSFPLINSRTKEWFRQMASFVDDVHSQSEQAEKRCVSCKLMSPYQSDSRTELLQPVYFLFYKWT